MDHVPKAKRSLMMRGIKGKDTAPEMIVRSAAHRMGLRFRLHKAGLPGRPDLVFSRWRTVVFVNGCFWHRHPSCKRTTVPKTNRGFWSAKFSANVARDKRNYALLEEQGWQVAVIWQCQCRTVETASEALRSNFRI